MAVIDSERPRTIIGGRGVAALLAVLALVHLYWATGLTWPAADEQALSLAVLGSVVSFGPAVVLPLAALEGCAAFAVALHARGGGRRRGIPRLVTAAVAAGILLRGAVGLVWIVIGKDGSGAVFPWLNALVYTPLCLVFGGAALRAAR
ncbi:DUF3995 domain-containing protein [Streptomyces sp. NBC_00233]|uniref:DUF3995 domain-containing protein n=1 Tax=Streptomyces sp. NBC_00233 TaxID=2975686 RepID=UPI00224E8AD3|nr:DUF3995 domain-containing protein [Streptomyces sp. NBC_00233]MCX5231562.1 DUF3995 domain-containing protein [Streptomyces sp. NBC_00233]